MIDFCFVCDFIYGRPLNQKKTVLYFLQAFWRRYQKMGENNPKLVLLFCGKRKSGKDYMTDWLLDCLKKSGKSAVILKLSGDLYQ